MYSRIHSCVAGLATLLFVVACLQCGNLSTANAKDGSLLGIEGVLTSVDAAAGSLTIRTRRMQDIPITVNANTKIERNDRRATLAAFQLGDRVEAKLASAMSNLAIKVEAVGP